MLRPVVRTAEYGYTPGMKTAISIPDPIFREADRYAQKVGKSRSQVYSDALRAYLQQHASDAVTDAMNRVCDQLDRQDDGFVRTASRRMLRRESW